MLWTIRPSPLSSEMFGNNFARQMNDLNLFALSCLFHENKELKDIPFSAFRVSWNNTDNGKITSITVLLGSFIRSWWSTLLPPVASRVRRCLIFGFTSHILKIRQQTTVFTQRIHMNTKLSTTISYSLNNLLHYVCVPVHKKTTTTKPHGFKENVKTFTLIIPEIGKIALFFNQNCLTAEV